MGPCLCLLLLILNKAASQPSLLHPRQRSLAVLPQAHKSTCEAPPPFWLPIKKYPSCLLLRQAHHKGSMGYQTETPNVHTVTGADEGTHRRSTMAACHRSGTQACPCPPSRHQTACQSSQRTEGSSAVALAQPPSTASCPAAPAPTYRCSMEKRDVSMDFF